MYILGLNAYHGDSSACIVKDGELLAAMEEERFLRVKHAAGFPKLAVGKCLEKAGIGIEDLDIITINRNPSERLLKKVLFSLRHRPSFQLVSSRLKNYFDVKAPSEKLANEIGVDPERIKAKVIPVEHHRAHLASSFYPSPFKKSAILSVDGFGDFCSTLKATGEDETINVMSEVVFPHSLGIFYLAMTQFLGFHNYGDEYKVMGLAPYGQPRYLDEMRELVKVTGNGEGFELNLDYFSFFKKKVSMTWEDTVPTNPEIFSENITKLLGPVRQKKDEVTQRHMDLAISLQRRYEEVLFALLDDLYEKTGEDNLCLAGGCGMNSVANGKITANTKFKKVFIQPAAGDSGGAIGAALYVSHHINGISRKETMNHSYYGPSYDKAAIEEALLKRKSELADKSFEIKKDLSDKEVVELISDKLVESKVIGWFQDSMEWGPRALGNRSIIADPRNKNMKDILNLKIKFRERFRPFAPSILEEKVKDWFLTDDTEVPFMLKVYKFRAEKGSLVPAVCHVDGSGRLQSVSSKANPRYHALISSFYKKTDVPMILNTSFNENEPIVDTPDQALDCFLRTKMDVLVLQNTVILREENL